MKVLFLAKEFRDGEGVSEYIKNLSEYLVSNGHEATIVSFDDMAEYHIDERVRVQKVPLPFEGDNIYSWAMMMNNELKNRAREIIEADDYDIVHCNDWSTIPGGVSLKKHLELPLAVTIHSTENERGFEGDHAELISELEWQGTFEADRVFVTKEDTKNSVLFDLDVPGEKLKAVDPYSPEWQSRILNTYKEIVKQEEKVIQET
ncbi:glycosyltransferase family 4 protein [Candidatus Nanohalovita haloferacivicina]|uniref:glycosyltransferase family 4 protein n=1 Tax=Candidatus Nanohalovita haloferacivicina TaxID=2978046 RepID=UPI00325FCC40|nr:Glycosyl transferase group 1 [Candidatus Nanohalobia archaeon BNXNv]